MNTPHRMARLALTVAAVLGVTLAPASAATFVVDQDGQASATDCGATQTALPSIGAAVAAAGDGDTVVVCPGTTPYNEQLVINKALTIRGFAQTQVVIRPSPMFPNSTSAFSGAPIAAVIVVGDTTATLSQLIVDAGGADLPSTDCSGPNLVGIFYRNASGVVSDSVVRNVRLPAGLEGCQAGLGIFAQSGGGGGSVVQVDGVSVRDYQKNGIVGNEAGTTIQVSNSLITGNPAANVSVQNGLQIGFGATGTIIANRIVDQIYLPCTFPYTPGGGCDTGASLGILVFDAAIDVAIYDNVIANTQAGIYIGGGIIASGSNRADLSGNTVDATSVFDGIVIVGDAHSVSRNTITRADGTGIFLSGNDNRVTSNRIQETAVGIWSYSGTGNLYPISGARANTLFNVETPALGSAALSAESARSRSGASRAASRTVATPRRY
ncbi:MAG: hypothetical protein HY824_00670 [Acidobacteria bacterium]|nr:hypothetical protein [Acidobacteriota bacterium]